jgi:hypothetical protein
MTPGLTDLIIGEHGGGLDGFANTLRWILRGSFRA